MPNAPSSTAVPQPTLPAFSLPAVNLANAQARVAQAGDRIARIRPVTAAALFGVVAGLVIGAAYLGGLAAHSTTLRAQAERLDGATSAGFTEEALSAAAGGLDPSALAIARRHDPYTVAGGAQRDRQAELLTARLESLRDHSPVTGLPSVTGLRQVNLGVTAQAAVTDAARPFRVAGALDASRDLECLTQAAYYEARGEGREGMQAVAQVVLNRARHPAFPGSVCGVVYQGAGRSTGCQFSFTCNGAMRGGVNRAAWDRARDVASRALSGAVFAPVGNATHFHTTGVSPGWRNALVRVNQVGQHLFYRFGGRAGSGAAFAYAARPSSGSTTPSMGTTAPPEANLQQAALGADKAAHPAGQAVAYSTVLDQDVRAGRPGETSVRTAETTAAATPGTKASAPVMPPRAAPTPVAAISATTATPNA